jgi:hypothetical protein
MHFQQRMTFEKLLQSCGKYALSTAHLFEKAFWHPLKFATFNSAKTYGKCSLAAESMHFQQRTLNFWTHVS